MHYYPRYTIGLDLGQRVDPAAMVLVEKIDHYSAYRPANSHEIHVLDAAVFPLGTPYTRIVASVRGLFRSHPFYRNTKFAVDATGLGRPVVDMLRRADLETSIVGVTITAGDKPTTDGYNNFVPKTELMSRLTVLLETGNLRINTKMPLCERLVRELRSVRVSNTPAGGVRMAASGREHDDLVMALALACWRANRA